MGKKLIRFTADWCSPCKTMAPVVESVAKDLNIPIRVVDQDDDPDNEVSAFGVRGLPTLILFDENGGMIDRITGAKSESELRKFMEQD